MNPHPQHDNAREYYGSTLQGSADLKTNACRCDAEALPPSVRQALAAVEGEIHERFYGCGSPLPPLLEACTVLDLGCGCGRDVYAAAKLAGPHGRVIGVDMTPGQLEFARRHIETHRERFGYAKATTEFHQGYLEDLAALGLPDASVDVVISNCVINLSPDKTSVLREVFRVLKPGGELHFSDVFADRRIPARLGNDPELHGECLAGAMYWEDFRRMMQALGCPDVRVTHRRPLEIGSEAIEARIGNVRFESITVRAFKLEGLEDRCEDYGHVAMYRGTIPDFPFRFPLDDHHLFETGRPLRVCGNTALMLADSRFAPHFELSGEGRTHFGLFDCSSVPSPQAVASGACC